MHYIIYASGGGFNSILGHVLGHLKIAEDAGYTPFVDMELHSNYYSEDNAVLGTRNVWEYFFLPVSSATRAEVYGGGSRLTRRVYFLIRSCRPCFRAKDGCTEFSRNAYDFGLKPKRLTRLQECL